jgi:hypothetical protein
VHVADGLDNFDYDGNFGTPSHSSYPSLSHHPSTTSLSSLASFHDTFSQQPSDNSGLLVNHSNGYYPHHQYPQGQIFAPPQSITRQSSCSSFTSYDQQGLSTPFEGNGKYSEMSNQTPIMPMINVFTTPGKSGRQRSLSRVQPYTRHGRSNSTASYASFDPFAEKRTPTSHGVNDPQASLERGMKKVSLHHRRTSSRTSTMASPIKKVPSTTRLSRSGRSASMSVLRSSPFDWSDAPPLPNPMGEEAIEATLRQKAQQCLSISSTAQQDKARTLWVRYWLKVAYTTAPGYTVPRQGLYQSYVLTCADYGMKEINSASFGKAVRAAYPGIKTRRLGVRGNSKYHYQSMRPALLVECTRLNDFGNSSG